MRKLSLAALAKLVIFIGLSMPVSAEVPPAVKIMLEKAKDAGQNQYMTVMEMAIASWPDEKEAIEQLAHTIAPDWVVVPDAGPTAEELAQIAEEKRIEKLGTMHLIDPVLWNGQVEFGAGFSNGDTNEKAFSLGAKFNRTFDLWDHVIELDVDYARSKVAEETRTTKNRKLLKHDAIWRGIGERASLVNHFEAVFDSFSGYDYRILESIGVGYQLFETENYKLRLEAMPGYRYSRLAILPEFEDSRIEQEAIFRVAADHYWKINDTLALTDKFSVIFSSRSTSYENKLDVTTTVFEKLGARFGIENRYETNPPFGSSHWDNLIKTTLIYNF